MLLAPNEVTIQEGGIGFRFSVQTKFLGSNISILIMGLRHYKSYSQLGNDPRYARSLQKNYDWRLTIDDWDVRSVLFRQITRSWYATKKLTQTPWILWWNDPQSQIMWLKSLKKSYDGLLEFIVTKEEKTFSRPTTAPTAPTAVNFCFWLNKFIQFFFPY